MAWVAAAKFVAHLGVEHAPEVREVLRHLQRAEVGAEDLDHDSHAATRDLRRFVEAVEVLDLRASARRGADRVLELHAVSARKRKCGGRHLLDKLDLLPRQRAAHGVDRCLRLDLARAHAARRDLGSDDIEVLIGVGDEVPLGAPCGDAADPRDPRLAVLVPALELDLARLDARDELALDLGRRPCATRLARDRRVEEALLVGGLDGAQLLVPRGGGNRAKRRGQRALDHFARHGVRDGNRHQPVVIGARLAHLERDHETCLVHERFLRQLDAPPSRERAVRALALKLERDAIDEAGDERRVDGRIRRVASRLLHAARELVRDEHRLAARESIGRPGQRATFRCGEQPLAHEGVARGVTLLEQ